MWRGNALETCLCGEISNSDINQMFYLLSPVGISFKELHEWKSRFQKKSILDLFTEHTGAPSIKSICESLVQHEASVDVEINLKFLRLYRQQFEYHPQWVISLPCWATGGKVQDDIQNMQCVSLGRRNLYDGLQYEGVLLQENSNGPGHFCWPTAAVADFSW